MPGFTPSPREPRQAPDPNPPPEPTRLCPHRRARFKNGASQRRRTVTNATTERPVLDWIRRHDESWWFVGIYVGLAVTLAIFSLFWLLLVVSVHFAFEIIRQAPRFDHTHQVLGEALWEVKFDLGLVTFALALSLYLPVTLGILGLSSATRAAAGASAVARTGTRLAAIQRAFRGIILAIDDAVLVGRGLFTGKKATGDEATTDAPHPAEDRPDPPSAPENLYGPREQTSWTKPWPVTAIGAMLFTVGSIVLIFATPLLTTFTMEDVMNTLKAEMAPF